MNNHVPRVSEKALHLLDALEELAAGQPSSEETADTYIAKTTQNLHDLLVALPRDMGATPDGCDRFQLEQMAADAIKASSLPELQAAAREIAGYIDCLIFIPRSKTLQ